MIHIIVAIDSRGAIGRGGDLLFHIRRDLRRFKELTMGNTIVMGRKTFESLPGGALPGRRNIVVSRRQGYTAAGAEVAPSIDRALAMAAEGPGDTYIIGGAQIYEATLPHADIIDLTRIHACGDDPDTFFPDIPDDFVETAREDADDTTPPISFITLTRR